MGAIATERPARLADHLGHGQPGLEQGEVGLGVEEDAPGVAVTESLVLGLGGAGEWLCAVGQVEDFAVPVQDSRARGQGAEDRVVGLEDLYRRPADLRPLPRLTSAPSARASSWAPRQMPSTGISRCAASASHSHSVASSG